MSEAVSQPLRQQGLREGQIPTLVALQEAGRNIDFVYHYADDGTDPHRTGQQFDGFVQQLKKFSEESEVSRHFAAALWDHLTPRFVGWRPGFIEGLETGHLNEVLTRVDREIDVKLGFNIPEEIRSVSKEIRARFDDLLFAYETGVWKDSRTASDIREELVFIASFDEKIRNILYAGVREIDLRRTIEDVSGSRDVGKGQASEAAFEIKEYRSQLEKVSGFLDRIRMAGISVQAGLTVRTQMNLVNADLTRREAPVDRDVSRDANQYWRGVGEATGRSTQLGRSQSLTQTARRGRSF